MMSSEKLDDKNPYQAVKETEERILKLQANIQHVKQRIHLLESEERAETEENENKVKENDRQIKELESQLQELQIRRSKGLHGDERIIAKAFAKHSRDVGVLAGKTGREAKDILDEQVLSLIKRSNALTHELKMREKELAQSKQKAREIEWRSYNESRILREESETMARVRELENDYQKVEKNLMECQIINSKYKTIHEQLKRELVAFPSLLEDLDCKYQEQRADLEKLTTSEERARERREKAKRELTDMEAKAVKARQEKEKVILEYSKALKPRQAATQRQSTDQRDSEAAEQWRLMRSEQEQELKAYREAFEKIKEAIGISDIHEAESRFLSQRATNEDLTALVESAEEKLQALKEESQELRTKNESIRGAELREPQIVLEQELEKTKQEQHEQAKRKSSAEAEVERINKLHADMKSGLWQLLQIMENYLTEEDKRPPTNPDDDAFEIASKIEDLLDDVFQKLQNQNINDLKSALKEELIQQKMEPTKLVTSAAAKKVKPSEEEETSDDEDFEKKRAMMKKEAQIYAEMKKKQQGRGRMMMI